MGENSPPTDEFETFVEDVYKSARYYVDKKPSDCPTFKAKYLSLRDNPDNRRVSKALTELEHRGEIETVNKADHGATYRLIDGVDDRSETDGGPTDE